MVTLEIIQKNLARAIRQSGFTQAELGRRLGVSQQTISHYLKGDKLPALDTFANLCRIIDVNPQDILTDKTF